MTGGGGGGDGSGGGGGDGRGFRPNVRYCFLALSCGVGLDIGYSPPPVLAGNIIGVICLLAGSDKKKKNKTEKGLSGCTSDYTLSPAHPYTHTHTQYIGRVPVYQYHRGVIQFHV